MLEYDKDRKELYIGINRKINLGNYETLDLTFGYTTDVSNVVRDIEDKEEELRKVFELWEQNVIDMVENITEHIIPEIKNKNKSKSNYGEPQLDDTETLF